MKLRRGSVYALEADVLANCGNCCTHGSSCLRRALEEGPTGECLAPLLGGGVPVAQTHQRRGCAACVLHVQGVLQRWVPDR